MNQYINFKLAFLVFLIVPFTSVAQSQKLVLLDEETMSPIPFAFTYSEFYSTMSDSLGVVYLPQCLDYSFNIRHLNYIERVVKCKQLKSIDTIYLKSQSFILDEIAIVAEKDKTDYYKLLNKILKKYQKSDFQGQIAYNYLLRNIKDDRIVEKISANISVDYSVGKKCTFRNKWLNYGNFQFIKEAPFLSLDIEQFVINLQPFHRNKNYSLLTSDKLLKRVHSIELTECDSCFSNHIKFRVMSHDQTCLITVDILKENVINATYFINSNANLNFFRVANGSSIRFEQLVLNYKFDESGIRQVINGEIFMYSDEIPIKTKFLLVKNEFNNFQEFNVLGNPRFTNIYQQFLFQPYTSPNFTDKSNYFIDTMVLSYLDEDDRKFFIESPLLWGRYKYLDGKIDSIPIYIHFITEDFYFDAFGKLTDYQNDLVVYQSYSFKKYKSSDSIVSIFPVLDMDRSKIYSKSKDPYINMWALNIVCSLYEVDRQHDMKLNVRNDSLGVELIKRELQAKYVKNRNKYNDFLDRILIKQKSQIRDLVNINYIIDSLINVDVFKSVIERDFGCSGCREGLVSEIIKEGFREKDRSPQSEKSHLFFKYGIIGLNILLNEVKKSNNQNRKLIGSYFSRIAELNIELNNVKEACKCLETFKSNWPEGFTNSAKQTFYNTNCMK